MLLRCLPSSFRSIHLTDWEKVSSEEWRPSWISEWNDFNNFESLSHSDTSHLVSAQSDVRFGRCPLKNFKMASIWWPSGISEWNYFSNSKSLCHCFLSSFGSIGLRAILDIKHNNFSNSESLCHSDDPHSFSSN